MRRPQGSAGQDERDDEPARGHAEDDGGAAPVAVGEPEAGGRPDELRGREPARAGAAQGAAGGHAGTCQRGRKRGGGPRATGDRGAESAGRYGRASEQATEAAPPEIVAGPETAASC